MNHPNSNIPCPLQVKNMEDLRTIVSQFNSNVKLLGSAGFIDRDIFAYQDASGNLVLDLDNCTEQCKRQDLKCYICGEPAFKISEKRNAVCFIHSEADSVD